MREVEFLHYQPGNGFWHRHDPRLKLLELVLWTVLILAGSIMTLAVTAVIVLLLHVFSGTRMRRLGRPLLFWFFMALAMVFLGGISESQPPFVLFGRVTVLGKAGLLNGGIRALRLLVILLAGQLLMATTDPAQLADVVRCVCFFLPRRWSGILGTAVALTLRFIPRMLDEASRIRDAALSRALGEHRSFFRRIFALASPLASATIRRSDVITEALLSRSYVYNPTPHRMQFTAEDFLLSSVGIIPPLLTFLF